MQSENFDKKIKDALSQRPPGNDDPAWDKMEVLLDKHMPREKKDRRIIFFLFSFLILGSGVFITWQINNGKKNEITETRSQKQKTATTGNNKSPETNTDKENSTPPISNTTGKTNKEGYTETPHTNSFVLPGHEIEVNAPGKIVSTDKNKNNSTAKKTKLVDQLIDELVKNTEPGKTSTEKLNNTNTNSDPVSTERQQENKEIEIQKPVAENKVDEQKQQTKEIPPVAVQKSQADKKKNNSSFANNLFFSLSAGPDFSSVGGTAGKVQLAYGGGIGYQVSKKFSIRTGFYVSQKIYSADPEDYHPPESFWSYYPNLEDIEANCKVYEVPLTIDYNISSNKKQSWFASAGVSSLFMKEETYDYYFKPNYSPNYITYTKSISNENKHYFSILDLSGGYRRNINKTFSLQAEPYVKIAMSGIGFGKVKLNSGGVLFSAIVKPFASKK
jgi:hypothetical protein